MNADGTIQIYGPQRVDINPDGVKVPKIKAATPSEDEEEKLDEFGEPIEEFDIMGDPGAFAEGDGGAPTPFERNKQTAIGNIKNSQFGQTAEGKNVVAKIEELDNAGKIKSGALGANVRGTWGNGEITVNSNYDNDPNKIASELVHEATHAVHREGLPASTPNTIDEEMRTNKNQLALYEEQRRGGFIDTELEKRRTDQAAGKLRDNVKSRYPNIPEHLQ
jgi:hypothetical protein